MQYEPRRHDTKQDNSGRLSQRLLDAVGGGEGATRRRKVRVTRSPLGAIDLHQATHSPQRTDTMPDHAPGTRWVVPLPDDDGL